MAHVAVLVPGIMGSVLKLGDEIIWPGSLASLMLPYKKMKELMRTDLVATDCIRSYFITDQYNKLIADLEACGFHENDGTLIIAAYDWRKDNALTASGLADRLDAVVAAQGSNLEISLLGHSMGGLVARYYLESGAFARRPALPCVKRLVTLGTPHRGAALVLPLVLGLEKRLFLSADQVLQVCADPRYPAAYQLLPPPGEPFAVDGAAGSQLQPLDVYDPSVAGPLGLVPANLAAAARFWAALDVSKRPKDVRYYCFTGTRQTTVTAVRIQKRATTWLPAKMEQEDGGDGTVPTWSGFFNGIERMFVGGEHSTIYRDQDLRRALAAMLGHPGVLAGVPKTVDLALREKVVEPGAQVRAALAFPTGVQAFDGVLTIERAVVDAAGNVTGFDPPISVNPIRYNGMGLDAMSVEFRAPDIRGIYRVALRDDLKAAPAGYDELIVQEPTRP